MTGQFDYDLFVIGAGSGGVRAARLAAQKGARVAIAEERYLGGTCVNVGCVPKKLFVYASQFSEMFETSRGYGWNFKSQPEIDWPTLRDNKTAEIQRLNAIYGHILEKNGAQLMEARATIQGPHQVNVNGRTFTARYILVATGSWPYIPEFPGSEYAVSSNEMFYLEKLPEKAVIVGGGYIAVEFAGILNGLGVETHLVYRRELPLREFDREMAGKVVEGMRQKGVHFHLNSQVQQINKTTEGLSLRLQDESRLDTGLVLYATGRRANTTGLGLENTNVRLHDDGSIIVDDNFCTAEPSIYALGDVIGRMQLTPVAIREAIALVNHLFAGELVKLDYSDIPTAIFSQPEFATVGLSEEDAVEEFDHLTIYTEEFTPMLQTLGGNDDEISMKLVVDGDSGRVIGCHMVGDHAAEIIQGLAVAMKAGATKADFDNTVGIHPSAAEEFVTLREVTRTLRKTP